MRNLLKALAVTAALVPGLALAQIANSRHDLSNVSTANVRSTAAGGTDQTCIFCHTPHRGLVQNLLWNRNNGTVAFTWGATNTTAGTPMPGTLQQRSLACLSCHDGTVGLGDVINSSGAAGTFAMQDTAGGTALTGNRLTGGMRVGNGAGSLQGNHPVSIAYPRAAGSVYFTNTSAVTGTAVNDFRGVVTAGCNTPTGACTTGATGAANITIYADGTAGYGIECGSCHDVHNRSFSGTTTPYRFFLRANTSGSQICLACHVK